MLTALPRLDVDELEQEDIAAAKRLNFPIRTGLPAHPRGSAMRARLAAAPERRA